MKPQQTVYEATEIQEGDPGWSMFYASVEHAKQAIIERAGITQPTEWDSKGGLVLNLTSPQLHGVDYTISQVTVIGAEEIVVSDIESADSDSE